jgi:hypothetical protein
MARKSMLVNGRAKWTFPLGECSCCNTKAERRKAKHSAKRDEEKQWRNEWLQAKN